MTREQHNTPLAYRYLLYRHGDDPMTGIAWKCSACAVGAIPVGDTMNVFDRCNGISWQTTRINETTVEMVRFWSDGNGEHGTTGLPTTAYIWPHPHKFDGPVSVRVADYRTPQPIPFGRGSTDDVHELQTVASVEAYLKGATA